MDIDILPNIYNILKAWLHSYPIPELGMDRINTFKKKAKHNDNNNNNNNNNNILFNFIML